MPPQSIFISILQKKKRNKNKDNLLFSKIGDEISRKTEDTSKNYCILKTKYFSLMKALICHFDDVFTWMFYYRCQQKNLNLDMDSNLGPPSSYLSIWMFSQLTKVSMRTKYLIHQMSYLCVSTIFLKTSSLFIRYLKVILIFIPIFVIFGTFIFQVVFILISTYCYLSQKHY